MAALFLAGIVNQEDSFVPPALPSAPGLTEGDVLCTVAPPPAVSGWLLFLGAKLER